MKHYVETYKTVGGFRWKVYHYGETGDREVVVMRSDTIFTSEAKANAAALEWMRANKVDHESF